MAKSKVRLVHSVISRQYFGAHVGSEVTESGIQKSPFQPLPPADTPVQLACTARGCGAEIGFELLSPAVHRRLIWQVQLRRLGIFIVALTIQSFGAYLAFESSHWLVIRIVGGVLFVPALATSFTMFLKLVFSWPPRYRLSYTGPGLPYNVRHRVQFD